MFFLAFFFVPDASSLFAFSRKYIDPYASFFVEFMLFVWKGACCGCEGDSDRDGKLKNKREVSGMGDGLWDYVCVLSFSVWCFVQL